MILEAWSWWSKEIRNGTENLTQLSIMLSVALLLITISGYLLIKKSTKKKVPLPPGPWGLPLLGNLPFLDRQLHSHLAQLAQTYGPVMKIRLGTRICVIFTSTSAAKEVLKDNDITFADRDHAATGLALSYGGANIALGHYGDDWRMLRKLCVTQLMTHKRLEALYGLRRREVRNMVNRFYSWIGCPINVGEEVLFTTFNSMISMMWGCTLEEEERKHLSAEFQEVVKRTVAIVSEPNLSDFFPVLAPFDLQGKVRKAKKMLSWFDKIFHHVIHRRRQMKSGGVDSKEEKDFLQILLELMDDQGYQKTPFTLTHLKALFIDMTVAGTSTTSTIVEWAMAELIKQPEVMRKVKQELEQAVGMNNVVEESHLSKLHYLDAVVKEVHRLHPVAPLLIPRCARESCIIGGYMVPKGAQIFVNVWAIQRDPKNWDNPLEFQPERFFMRNEWDFCGNDFRYLPFGSGRRICVGSPMAQRSVNYLLASLVHSFDWELPKGDMLDLSEAFGIELRKKTPLMAIPTPRLLDPELYA